MSDGCETILGYTATEPKDDFRYVSNCVDRAYWDAIEATVDHSRTTMTSFQTRSPIKDRAGNKLCLQVNGRPRPNKDDETLWHCLALDITRQVQAEEETIEHIECAEQSNVKGMSVC